MNAKTPQNPKSPKNPQTTDRYKKSSPSYYKRSVISSLSDVCGGGGVRYSTVKAKEQRPFPISLIIGAVIATALFMFVVFSFVGVAEMSAEISDMKHEISELSGEQATLEGQLDYRYTKSEIENTAASLGLNQSKTTTVYFSDEDSEDVSEVIEPETTLGGAIDSLLSAIGKNFRKFIDFMN